MLQFCVLLHGWDSLKERLCCVVFEEEMGRDGKYLWKRRTKTRCCWQLGLTVLSMKLKFSGSEGRQYCS